MAQLVQNGLNKIEWTVMDQKDLIGPKLTELDQSGPNEPKRI